MLGESGRDVADPRIVKELLLYSREPQAKEAAVPVDVRKVAEAAASLVRAQGRARDKAIEIAIPADLPPVLASEGALVQVLLNLLLNAADVAGERIEVTAGRRDGRVILAVSDDGPGPREKRAQIFDRSSPQGPRGRDGLGCRSRCRSSRAWGNLVLAESPRGARFEIDLPRRLETRGCWTRSARADVIPQGSRSTIVASPATMRTSA